MSSGNILFVEDERAAQALIREALEGLAQELLGAATVAEGWESFLEHRPALLILDINLPDGSGFELCRRVRAHNTLASTPIILLTGRADIVDKREGFDAGADHYLIKPIQLPELVLWVRALLKRIDFAEREGGVLRAEGCVVDPQRHAVLLGEREVRDLTRKEFELLYELVRRRPRVLTKEQAMQSLWKAVLRDNTIEVHVRNLRRKLGAAGARVLTVGDGYRFE